MPESWSNQLEWKREAVVINSTVGLLWAGGWWSEKEAASEGSRMSMENIPTPCHPRSARNVGDYSNWFRSTHSPAPVLHLALLPYQRIPALMQIYVQPHDYRSGCQSEWEKLFIRRKSQFSSIYSTISLQRVKPKALGIAGTGEGHRHTFQCHPEK